MKKGNSERKTRSNAKSSTKEVATRKRDFVPIVIVVLGIILGGLLIGVGVYNNINSNYNNLGVKTEEELREEVAEKSKVVAEIRTKRNEEYDTSAMSEEYEKYSRELSVAEGELYDAEAELYNTQSGFYDNLKRDKIFGSMPLIVLGAVVIVLGLGLAMKAANRNKRNVILTVTEEK